MPARLGTARDGEGVRVLVVDVSRSAPTTSDVSMSRRTGKNC
jgi:hypothetical protein